MRALKRQSASRQRCHQFLTFLEGQWISELYRTCNFKRTTESNFNQTPVCGLPTEILFYISCFFLILLAANHSIRSVHNQVIGTAVCYCKSSTRKSLKQRPQIVLRDCKITFLDRNIGIWRPSSQNHFPFKIFLCYLTTQWFFNTDSLLC